MKSWAESFYKGTNWQFVRDSYLSKVGGLCERCLKRDELVPADIVNHKIYLTPANINDPSVTLSFDNLEALCIKCHNQEHFAEKRENRFSFSDDGKIIPLPPIFRGDLRGARPVGKCNNTPRRHA